MKRKRPLKRTPMPPRKAWMKRQGDAKRQEKRDTDGTRRNYRLGFPTCQCCEKRRSKHTHEIASGGARAQSVYHRETFLAVCVKCHEEIHQTSNWPIARQLYQKMTLDPEHYDRRLVLRLKGWDEETAITQEEVDAWSPSDLPNGNETS